MAFTGVATYDVYSNEIGESVSELVSLVSPMETPFLDDIGDGSDPITSPYYTWLDKFLLPDTFAVSSAIASSAATSNGLEVGANVSLLRVGDLLRSQNATGGVYEMMAVTSIGASAATIYVTRAYAGTSANSQAAGQSLVFLGSAVEEGSAARTQRRRGKQLLGNYIQIFREDIKMSTLETNAQPKSSGQASDPFQEEVADKTKEVLKQLEKHVIMGRTNGNTIGADDKETTLAGIYYSLATNVVSHATFTNSIFNNLIENINGYTDVQANANNYTIYAGTRAFRLISNQIASKVQVGIDQGQVGQSAAVDYFTDLGQMKVKHLRWLPTGSALVMRRDFVKVKPYRGNSFQSHQFDSGALAKEGYVAGAYGVELHQEPAHGRFDGLSA